MNQDSDPFACHLDLHSKLTMLLFWGRDPHLVTWDEVQIWGDFEMFETTVPCPESFRLHRWAVAASWIWRKDHRHACKRNTSWKRIRTPAVDLIKWRHKSQWFQWSSLLRSARLSSYQKNWKNVQLILKHSSRADRICRIAFLPPGTALSHEALDTDLWILDGETDLPSGTGRAESRPNTFKQKLTQHLTLGAANVMNHDESI